jgi:hypothetical protein
MLRIASCFSLRYLCPYNTRQFGTIELTPSEQSVAYRASPFYHSGHNNLHIKLEESSASHTCPLLHCNLLKHVCAATNMHTTVEKLLGVAFSNLSDAKLYRASKTQSQSCEIVKYGHKCLRTQNQE